MSALPLRPALADVLDNLAPLGTLTWRQCFGLRENVGGAVVLDITADGATAFGIEGKRQRRWIGPVKWIGRDPSEALGVLIDGDVVPVSFAHEPRRAFIHHRPGVSWHGQPHMLTSHPSTVVDLVAWASLGPAAILHAEALARETVARLRPWGAPQPDRVVWCVRDLSGREEDGTGIAWDDVEFGANTLESDGGSPSGVRIESAHDLWVTGLVIAGSDRSDEGIVSGGVVVVVPPIVGAL